MWQALNLSKRVDAVEKGLLKLSSMVEDLIQDVAGVEQNSKSKGNGGTTPTTPGSGRLKAGGEDSPAASSPRDATEKSDKPNNTFGAESPSLTGEQAYITMNIG